MKKEKLPGEHDEFDDVAVAYPEEEDMEASQDQSEESDDDEQEESLNMAPTAIPAYLKFMLDKDNRKDKLSQMPAPIRSRILRGLFLGIIILVLGVIMAIVYRNARILILPCIFSIVLFVSTLKNYLDGATRQYVTLRGTVVRSDYAKSALAAAKNAAQKTAKADFFYRSFIFKKDDEYIKINCRKARELPQEGDKVRVIVHARAGIYEDEGIIEMMSYISIDRIA